VSKVEHVRFEFLIVLIAIIDKLVDSHIVTIQIIIMADKLDDQVAENVN
jgi:hypothetical protein